MRAARAAMKRAAIDFLRRIMSAGMMQTAERDYRALTEDAGAVDASGRAFLEMTGADRAKFLHNLSSNDILRLTPGDGCEALLLNAKGRIVGHVFVYCTEDSLILDASPGQNQKLLAHLDRYIIREKVTLHDRTADMGQWLLAGPRAQAVLESLGLEAPQAVLGHVRTKLNRPDLADVLLFLRRSGLLGAATWTLLAPRDKHQALAESLQNAGVVLCGPEAAEAVRIEAGVPQYDRDISEDNLPQELNRTDRAISFTKGCYLGQETVARIDALGHVNRTLAGLRFAGSVIPEAGCELSGASDAVMGRVTSAAFSPRVGGAVALGYVRQGHNLPGSKLSSSAGDAEVVPLPMI